MGEFFVVVKLYNKFRKTLSIAALTARIDLIC